MSRGVVFDVDDTLYLEREYVRSGFLAVGEHVENEYGVRGFAAAAWELFVGGHRGTIFDDALNRLRGAASTTVPVKELVDVYREHAPAITLLPDSAVLLEHLQGFDVPIAVVTDGPAASQHAKITALRLRRYVSTVIVTADLGFALGKPHEAAFLRVQHELGLEGDSLTYVADNPDKDFIAPQRLGWRTVRVRRPGSLHERRSSGNDVDEERGSIAEIDLSWLLAD